MLKLSIRQRAGKWLALAAFLGVMSIGVAMAQAEPSLKQIYETAQTGNVTQAQTMVQQVLIAHPNSARAYFVQAELFARQGEASRARESLVKADKLAPGLPFAKPEAVQALRTQLASRPNLPAVREGANRGLGSASPSQAAVPAAPASSFPLGLGLALGGGAIALAIFLLRKKPAPAAPAAYTYPAGNPAMGSGSSGLSGPQSFGSGGGTAAAPAAAQAGQPGYGQPAAGGMGGRVMGGLATGLAVGAGVMAAQAIGKNLMGNNEHPAHLNENAASGGGGSAIEPLSGNSDLGGQNFGVNDADSWDDGSASADSGGGGDWDT